MVCAVWLIVRVAKMARQLVEWTRGTAVEPFAWAMPATIFAYFAWSVVEFNFDDKPFWEFLAKNSQNGLSSKLNSTTDQAKYAKMVAGIAHAKGSTAVPRVHSTNWRAILATRTMSQTAHTMPTSP